MVEAPSIVKNNDNYYLAFASGGYKGAGYSTQIAVSKSLQGPFKRESKPQLTQASTGLDGPGGAELLHLADGHSSSCLTFRGGRYNRERQDHLGVLSLVGGAPAIVPPESSACSTELGGGTSGPV